MEYEKDFTCSNCKCANIVIYVGNIGKTTQLADITGKIVGEKSLCLYQCTLCKTIFIQ